MRRRCAACCLMLTAARARLAGCGDELSELEGPAPATEQGRAHNFDVERIASGLNRPVWVGAAPGDPGALWVLEQPGRVIRIEGGRRTTLLDISDQVADRRRAGPARDRLPPRLRRPTGGCSCTGRTAAATRASPSSARARPHDRAAARPRAADGRPAGGEPQRRPARVRARRPALPRARRRRRRVRPAARPRRTRRTCSAS